MIKLCDILKTYSRSDVCQKECVLFINRQVSVVVLNSSVRLSSTVFFCTTWHDTFDTLMSLLISITLNNYLRISSNNSVNQASSECKLFNYIRWTLQQIFYELCVKYRTSEFNIHRFTSNNRHFQQNLDVNVNPIENI